mgnify:CR=1 FL=1
MACAITVDSKYNNKIGSTNKMEQTNIYEDDDVLGAFFKALAGDDIKDTGEWVSLDRMERSMYLEGLLEGRDVRDPSRKRNWE